ncbi:MAG: AAA family ATPase, partial [Rubrivivax sp.]|nr:AAA family ATPase [Rubrivivax sp.]
MPLRLSLVGMPGCGKTTVGRHLARQLNLAFTDSDQVIESRVGMPIRHFFDPGGEDRVREFLQGGNDRRTPRADPVLGPRGGALR